MTVAGGYLTWVVGLEVFETEVYPDFEPFTFTVIFLPLSAFTSSYDDLVAFLIALPLRARQSFGGTSR